MTTRPPDDLNDPRFDDAWRRASHEEPPAALDDAIRAAARREVGARPQDIEWVPEATRPERWWFPLAAAATIGAIAIGLLQLSTPDRIAPADERRVVSDMPEGAKEAPRASEPRPSPPLAPLAKDRAPPSAPVDKPNLGREEKLASDIPARASPPIASSAERRQRQEPKPFPARKPDEGRSTEAAQPPAAPAPKKAEAASEAPVVAQSPAPAGRVNVAEPDRDSRATVKSRLSASAPAPGAGAPSTAAGTIAPTPPNEETAPVAPPIGAVPPMAAPQRAAGMLAADRLDSVERRAKERAAMPVADWIALMRRLRDEQRFDELAKELAAFRSLHADANALLPQDLRELVLPAAR